MQKKMRIHDVPNISKEMKALYKKFLDSGDFAGILPDIDSFLNKYPYYREAIIFKARALMAIGRDNEALRHIKMAKRVEKAGLIGRFDEAEIYLRKKRKDDSINTYIQALEAYASELEDGIRDYLLCCNPETSDQIKEITCKALAEFFDNKFEYDSFEKLREKMNFLKDKMSYSY
jgi:tetratricopeptide (TPR) repeat protein